jgi:hypothetical protein
VKRSARRPRCQANFRERRKTEVQPLRIYLPGTRVNEGKQKGGTVRSPGSLSSSSQTPSRLLRLVCDNLTGCDLGWVRKQRK